MKMAIALLGAAALGLAGCGGDVADTTPVEESERRIGAAQHDKLLAQFGGAYRGPEARYLDEIGQKLAGTAGLEGDCTFTLVNTDVVNAFAVPGCYIYVTRGLMALMNNEAQLAAVLGHELGHVARDHSKQQQRRSILRQLGVLAVGLATDSALLTNIAGGAAQLFTLRYSRKHEHEADDFGVSTLIAAGYDPHEAAEMLESLMLHEQFEAGGTSDVHRMPEWGRTHPLTTRRIEQVRAAANKAGTKPDQLADKRDTFLKQVAGLLYGDDPLQGFVRGRRFAHPGLGLAFEVPRGFQLTNSPAAVLIVGPDGVRGRFAGGGAPTPGGLEAYARAIAAQAFGEAAGAARASRARVNGFPALFLPLRVDTSEGTVEALVAAYAMPDGSAFHFLVVGPPDRTLPPETLDMVGSLERITAAEARALQTRVIAVERVPQSGGIDRLAETMAGDRPLARLRALNGLKEGETLPAGDLAKVVRAGTPEQ